MVSRSGNCERLVNSMPSNLADVLWGVMRRGELYSIGDLVSLVGESLDDVRRGLAFLAEFGFIERVSEAESIFRKKAEGPSPSEAVTILQEFVHPHMTVPKAF
jgi:hypothetical protein